ncbi:MAG: hypothetical protein NZ889_02975 [Candidatus Pacearchaeota archaeon]|nr:hypothetical protein [Candidatus Pacearchaeota archaeon]
MKLNIKSFDDMIREEEKRIIDELDLKNKKICPHLKREGEYFFTVGRVSRRLSRK